MAPKLCCNSGIFFLCVRVEGAAERCVDTKLGESQSRDFREASLEALFAKLPSSVDS